MSREWIADARTDGLFLWQGLALSLALWAVAATGPRGLALVVLCYGLYDCCHLTATLPVTALDRDTRRRNPPWLWGGLAGYVLLSAGCFLSGGLPGQLWSSAFLYWGTFHIIRQHAGFLRLYQQRAGGFDKAQASRQLWLLYVGCVTPGLVAVASGGALADRLHELRGVLLPPIPAAVAWAAVAVFAGLAALVVRDAIARRRAGHGAGRLTLLHLGLVLASFSLAYLLVARVSLFMVIIFVSAFHNLQYLSLVRFTLRNRHQAEPAATGPFSRFFAGGALRYAAFAGLLGLTLWALKPGYSPFLATSARGVPGLIGAVFISIQNLHYFWDGFAWKVSRDRRLRRDLGLLSQGSTSACSASAVP